MKQGLLSPFKSLEVAEIVHDREPGLALTVLRQCLGLSMLEAWAFVAFWRPETVWGQDCLVNIQSFGYELPESILAEIH